MRQYVTQLAFEERNRVLKGAVKCHSEQREESLKKLKGNSNLVLKLYETAVRTKHHKMSKQYFVYIMSSFSKTLHIGVTNNLERRVWQHKNGQGSSHTKKYRITKLVYFEETPDVTSAISREKVLKGWKREKKIELINDFNPSRKDLSLD